MNTAVTELIKETLDVVTRWQKQTERDEIFVDAYRLTWVVLEKGHLTGVCLLIQSRFLGVQEFVLVFCEKLC